MAPATTENLILLKLKKMTAFITSFQLKNSELITLSLEYSACYSCYLVLLYLEQNKILQYQVPARASY